MTTRAEMLSLLRAAREAPEDATRRLVLADWLEENGDEADREKAALLRAKAAGVEAAPTRLAERYPALAGLPARLSSTPEGFVEVYARAKRLASKSAEWLAESEEWAWVSDLTVVDCTEKALGRFAQSGILRGPTALSFADAALGPEGATRLAEALVESAVRKLVLAHCFLETAGLKQLVQRATFLPQLTFLDVGSNGLSAGACAALAAAPFGALRELWLGSNLLHDGPGHLASAAWLPGLRGLDLSSSELMPAGLQKLLTADLSGLEFLYLGDNPLPPWSAADLARAESLTALRDLWLENTAIGDEGVAALARSPLLPRLHRLGLDNCGVTEVGLRSFDEAPGALSLRLLTLRSCREADGLAAELARSRWAASLKGLSFEKSSLSASGADALAEAEHLGKLAYLDVSGTHLPGASIARLRERFGGDAVVNR